MRLENWCVIQTGDDYTAPEHRRQCLHGNVHGHHKFPAGKEVTTSAIVGKSGEAVVTKSGQQYELGTVDAKYEAKFPNAKQRLLRPTSRKF